jgi:hypothetical protein
MLRRPRRLSITSGVMAFDCTSRNHCRHAAPIDSPLRKHLAFRLSQLKELPKMSFRLIFSSPGFLRNVLRVDALSCVACGLLQLVFPVQMAELLRLPGPLLAYTGEFLLAYAALVIFISTRQPIPRMFVGLMVAGNLGWAAACVLLLISGTVQPTALGMAYVLLQALTVAVLAELQYFGLRSTPLKPAW